MAKFSIIQLDNTFSPATVFLAGAVKHAGHDFSICVSSNPKKILSFLKSERPSLCGFSCTTGIHVKTLKLAKIIKTYFSTPIILGGYHPTLVPEVIKHEAVDMICRGEGEKALVELLDAIESNNDYTNIANLWVKRPDGIIKNGLGPLMDPLDDMCFSNYSIYKNYPKISNNSICYVSIGRGCPYNCSYCSNGAIKKLYKDSNKFVRFFSVDRVMNDIRIALENFPKAKVVGLLTENIGHDSEYLSKLIKAYNKNYSLPYILGMRVENINNKNIETLSGNNCYLIGFGVESGSERIRKNIMKRNYSNKEILAAAKLLHANKIRFTTLNILGTPTETLEEIWETIKLNQQLKPTLTIPYIFTPYPGTALFKMAHQKKMLRDDYNIDKIFRHFQTPAIKTSHYKEIINLKNFFIILVLFPKITPIVKLLIKIPPNFIFRLISYVSLAYMYTRLFRLNLTNIMTMFHDNLHYFFRNIFSDKTKT